MKVLDFGLVKDTASQEVSLTLAGAFCGSPETISPEAVRGQDVGPQSDLYALAAVGYFLLTGKGLFDATELVDYLNHHLKSAPVPFERRGVAVPDDLAAVLFRCLEKDPDARPATANILRRELDDCTDAGRWTQENAAEWWRVHPSRR